MYFEISPPSPNDFHIRAGNGLHIRARTRARTHTHYRHFFLPRIKFHRQVADRFIDVCAVHSPFSLLPATALYFAPLPHLSSPAPSPTLLSDAIPCLVSSTSLSRPSPRSCDFGDDDDDADDDDDDCYDYGDDGDTGDCDAGADGDADDADGDDDDDDDDDDDAEM